MKKLLSLHALLVHIFGSCMINDSYMEKEGFTESFTVAQKNTLIPIEEKWSNISVDSAKILIKKYGEYADKLGEKNATKAVWFKKTLITESFSHMYKNFNKEMLAGLNTDGYRIYFARYPRDWAEVEKREKNTLVMALTVPMGYTVNEDWHRDILEINKQSALFVLPLHHTGLFPTSCQGTALLE